jgi:hypothetical protein
MKFLSLTTLILFLMITLFSFISPLAYSAESDSEVNAKIKEKQLKKEEWELKRKNECISRRNEETAALVAKDWENLDILARAYVRECKDVFDPQWLSRAHENIAIAKNAQGKFKDALVASNECAKAYYGSPGCHIQKSSALIALGKKAEALKSLDISERLAHHGLEGAKRNLNQAYYELDKELYTSIISEHESQLYLIDSMRSELTQ